MSIKALLTPAAALLAVTALTYAPDASAQERHRISGRVEAGGSLFVSSAQSQDFNFGLAARGDFALRVAGPFVVHAFGSYNRWGPSTTATQAGYGATGIATVLGGGVGIEPWLTPRVGLRIEAELGASLNGGGTDLRLAWGAGVGAWFNVASVFDLGPIVRINSIVSSPSESTSQGGPGDALYLTFGLAFSLHPPNTPAPEPAAVAAQPEAAVVVAPAPAPAVAQTVVPVAAPVAAPVATTVVTAPVPVDPQAVATPGAQTVTDDSYLRPAGRHGRHGRHGRGGRGGGHGGRRGRRRH